MKLLPLTNYGRKFAYNWHYFMEQYLEQFYAEWYGGKKLKQF
ncbi:MAG: hypothetical protein ABIO60_08770 [Aquaticitalea sp.]